MLRFPDVWPEGRTPFIKALAALLTMDALLIALYIALAGLVFVNMVPAIPARLNITEDAGVAEWVTYGKWAVLVVVLTLLSLATGARLFGAFALVFLMVLLDDALQGHERLGEILGRSGWIVPLPGLSAHHAGELLVFGAMGCFALGLIALGAHKTDEMFQPFVWRFLIVIAGLAVCGVGFDAVHSMLTGLPAGTLRSALNVVFGVLEDGGEMVFASLGAAYGWGAYRAIPAGAHVSAG